MRQVGSLSSATDAKRFTAYLITQNISALAEEDRDGQWIVWARNENDLETAKAKLTKFKADPGNDIYSGVEKQADTIQRHEAERHEQIRKNVVQMRGKWGRGAPARKRPLTITLIVVSIAVSLVGGLGTKQIGTPGDSIYDRIRFVGYQSLVDSKGDVLADIKHGQLWRLVTPMFIHGGPLHLVFNMIWIYQLGALIEWRMGGTYLVFFAIVTAIISNVAQAVVPPDLIDTPVFNFGGSPFFGGMSGVVYALLGYLWVRGKVDPTWGVRLNQTTVVFMLVWLFLCMTPLIGRIANVAHLAGLLAGIAMVYVPWPFGTSK